MITDYDFYLVGNPQSVRLQLIEITHPAFSQVYRFVRNHALGVTVTQDGEQVFYQYMPIQLQKSKASSDLDQSINITIGDVSEIIPDEIDRVRQSNLFSTVKPIVNYREYYADDLTRPCLEDVLLEVTDYSLQREGTVFKAEARDISNTKTGLVYNLDTHPLLRAYVL